MINTPRTPDQSSFDHPLLKEGFICVNNKPLRTKKELKIALGKKKELELQGAECKMIMTGEGAYLIIKSED